MNPAILNGVLFSATVSGIKNDDKPDLSVILLPKGSQTAGVFTQNIFCAAPVLVAKNHLNNDIRALVINSGNANAGTGIASGSQGLKNALAVCELVADSAGFDANQVLPFSTGVIGEQLPMHCFEAHIKNLVAGAGEDKLLEVANAILTTDLTTKISASSIEFQGKTVNIVGIAKGSGMICPDMATMLSFVITDAQADSKIQLQDLLIVALNQSFNRITIDGDTSTNDALTLSATGQSGVNIDEIKPEFSQELNKVCQTLAHKIVEDGEGATKFVEVSVSGGSSADCLSVAYTVAHSPLVKTALFACDANVGRLLMAIGRAKVAKVFAQSDVSVWLNQLKIIDNGSIKSDYTDEKGSAEMAKSRILINIVIGTEQTTESVWTTDFSYEYVKINAEYRS